MMLAVKPATATTTKCNSCSGYSLILLKLLLAKESQLISADQVKVLAYYKGSTQATRFDTQYACPALAVSQQFTISQPVTCFSM